MSAKSVRSDPRFFVSLIVFLQLALCLVIFFDIPIARQVVGFAYLTFIPGYILVKLLKVDSLGKLGTVLFSVGFSIAFLMLTGLAVNELGSMMNLSGPLSILPLFVALNGLILFFTALVYLRRVNIGGWKIAVKNFPPSALSLALLPILSIVGTYFVNSGNSNSLLMLALVGISMLFAFCILRKQLRPELHPFALSMIALALLFQSSLVSNYIVGFGSDVPVEYFVFRTTQINTHWSPIFAPDVGYGRINAMLSVTILPTTYSTILNLSATWVFKILFPLIFSLVPLGLYSLLRGYVGKKYAFISSFLLMAQSTFYTEMLGLNRQMIAELFFILLFFVVLNKKIQTAQKMTSFIIFSIALIVSHYALAEIFLIFLSFTLIFLMIYKHPGRNVTIGMVLLFFVMMFSWYIYTSGSSVFNSFVSFGEQVTSQLGDFLNPASRGQEVLTGIGIQSSPSIWNTISRAFAYLTQGLIIIGFLALILKRTRIRFDREYYVLSIAAMSLLAMLLVVPGLANTLNMTRFYHILLFFIAPFCAMGAAFLVKLVTKQEKELLVSIMLLVVIIPYFLFQTGFMYEITKSDSWSLPLSEHRMGILRLYGSVGYIDEYSVIGTKWLSREINFADSKLYADGASATNVLSIYGDIYRGYINGLNNQTQVEGHGIVYLSTLNVEYGIITYGGNIWNSTELSFLGEMNELYTNGRCEIRQLPS